MRAALAIVTLLLLGLTVMLFTVAIGAGDTSVGNSQGPWIEGELVFYGTPVLIGAFCYRLFRRLGAAPRRALMASVLLLPGMALVVALGYFLVVELA
jgi:hypothetical protein